jgi:hypothetical protein
MLKDERARAVFNTLTVISMGDGKQFLFWMDRWINGLTASEIAPLVADSVASRTKNRRRVAEALLQNSWTRDVGGGISLEGWLQCIALWEAIDLVHMEASRPDRFRWTGSPTGKYSAKITYKMLC